MRRSRVPVTRRKAARAAGARRAATRKASLRSRPAGRHVRRLIAVDVGNSETVVGVLHRREVQKFWRLTSGRLTADEVRLQLDALLRDAGLGAGEKVGAVLCSVAPSL